MRKVVTLSFLACALFLPPGTASQSGNSTPIWFQHDDFVDMDGDDTLEFVPDMLTRWEHPDQWRRALSNTSSYSIHENLFKTDGAPNGMGAKFLRLLRDYFGNLDHRSLHIAYLRRILPVLHAHGVKLHIHTVGSKGDFVPWQMYGTSNGTDTITYPRDTSGLGLVLNTLQLINSVCDSLFTDGYRVRQVKLQSVLSGIWQRGLQNNVYCALEYMKEVQARYPTIEFYLGDALLQRRDYNRRKSWRDAYTVLRTTMLNDPRGYAHLNFRGIRIEFDKRWADSLQFENAQGWSELADSGAFDLIKGFGWKAGLEHNNPFANDEWGYQALVLRTAQKSRELNLNWDFAVLHSDEAGGEGRGYPFAVVPENRGPNEPPTFSSVLNRLHDFYNLTTSATTGASTPERYELRQNYPNPFNPSTTIKFDLPEPSQVSLIIYDLLGRKIAELENGMKEAGYHSATWSASETASGVSSKGGYASGVYFARFTATDANGNVRLSKVSKLLLAK